MLTLVGYLFSEQIRDKVYRLFLTATVVILPALITLLLPYLFFGATLFDFIPGYVNDEIYYWHQTLTFSRVGFAGGYYTIEEHPAAAQFSHFGAHGPMFPILYGTIGYIVGWQRYSGPLFHLVLITLALGLFIYVTQPDYKRLILTGLFLLTFWPLLLLLPTNMQEGLHYAIAIILAIMFYVLFSREGNISVVFKSFFLLFLTFASLVRPSWSLLFVPYLILCSRRKSGLDILLSLFKATVAIAAIFWVYVYLASPFPDSGFFFIKALTFQVSLQAIIEYFLRNLYEFISFQEKRDILLVLEVLQRYQLLFLLVVFGIKSGVALFKCLSKGANTKTPEQWEVLFHFYNLGAILIATSSLYIVGSGGDYRVVGPYLLLSVLLLITSRQKLWLWLVGIIILSNTMFGPVFVEVYKIYRSPNFVYDRQAIAAFQEATNSIIYDPHQGPWCNTLLSSVYPYEFASLPAGIGISYVFRDPNYLEFPLKSKYLLSEYDILREDNPDYQRFRDRLNIEFLSYTPYGVLYRNLDAKCE